MGRRSDFEGQQVEDALRRGVGYVERRQWQQAINALNSCLQADPANLEARYNLALSQSGCGRANEALRVLEETLMLPRLDDFNRVRLLKLVGQVAIQTGNYQLAADNLDAAFKITGVGGAPILNQLGQVMCKAGDFERGFGLYFQALEHASQ